MKNWLVKRIIFWGAIVGALLLYAHTVPEGIPWGVPTTSNFVWLHLLKTFGGYNVALASVFAALAAGLVSSLAFRFFGWRIAIAAAVTWMFLPKVWYAAVVGNWRSSFAAVGLLGVWFALFVIRRLLTRVRMANLALKQTSGGRIENIEASHDDVSKRAKWNRIAGWFLLAGSLAFAYVSVKLHDFSYGNVASEYAKGVVEEAGERIIVLNGVVDAQVRREMARRNLTKAVRLGESAEIDAEIERHPERFYLMNGMSTTLDGWERRWAAFKPHLESSDPFVVVGRRLFAFEGIVLADGMLGDESKTDEAHRNLAWRLYQRIYDEIDPGSVMALARLSERRSLVEWNNKMVDSLDRGDIDSAGRFARIILSNEKWLDFIPANAVMGSVAALGDDYKTSEMFFRRAIASTNEVPPIVLNDFADTLLHLDKLDEAEAMARRAVKGSDEKFWIARLTLAEILSAQKQRTSELYDLCQSALTNAPSNMPGRIRMKLEKMQQEASR